MSESTHFIIIGESVQWEIWVLESHENVGGF